MKVTRKPDRKRKFDNGDYYDSARRTVRLKQVCPSILREVQKKKKK